MQARFLRLCVAILAIAGFLLQAPSLRADTVLTLEYLGNGNPDGHGTYTSQQLSVNNISLTGTSGTFTSPVGQFHWGDPPNFPNQQIINTFCAELTNHGPDALPQVGGDATFRIGSLSDLHGLNSNSTLSGDQVKAIKALYGNNYDFANDRAVGTGALAQNFENAAFQLALWEILYDPANYNLSGDNFSVSGAVYDDIKNEAQAMLGRSLTTGLANYNASGYEVVSLLSPSGAKGSGETDFQDHITVRPKAVPAPGGLMLAGFGALGLFGRARWNRRPTATA
jgi:hypothetical protein